MSFYFRTSIALAGIIILVLRTFPLAWSMFRTSDRNSRFYAISSNIFSRISSEPSKNEDTLIYRAFSNQSAHDMTEQSLHSENNVVVKFKKTRPYWISAVNSTNSNSDRICTRDYNFMCKHQVVRIIYSFNTSTPHTILVQAHSQVSELVVDLTVKDSRIPKTDVFKTSQFLVTNGSLKQAVVRIPLTASASLIGAVSVFISVVAPLGCIDVSGIERWTSNTNGMTGMSSVTIFKEKLIMECIFPPKMKFSFQEKQMLFRNDTASKSSTSPGMATSLPICPFIDGEDLAYGWIWGNTLSLNTCSLHKLARKPDLNSLKVLLLGDSQMRTTFQCLMSEACTAWNWLDYPRKKSWCGLKDKMNPKKRLNELICGGDFTVYGDGCWSGGAVWQSFKEEGGMLVYADVHSLSDERYLRWSFLQLNITKYDVVLVGSGLHDVNEDVSLASFVERARRRLDIIRTWHSGAVFNVGPWTTASQKSGGYWWAHSVTKNHFMSVSLSQATRGPNLWWIKLMTMTLPVSSYTPDGVHLLAPTPLSQVTAVLWHNVLCVTQNLFRDSRDF